MFLIAGITSGYAQKEHNPVKWSTSYKTTDINQYQIIIKANIKKDWYLYSVDNVHDNSHKILPITPSLQIDKESNYSLINQVVEKGKLIVHYDPFFEIDVRFYNNKVTFYYEVSAKNNNDVLNGEFEAQLCNDKIGVCVLSSAKVYFDPKALNKD